MFRGVLEAGGVVTRGPRVNDHPRGSARVLAKGPACILHRYYSTLHVSVYSDVSPPSPPLPPRPNRLRPSLFFHAAALEPWNERGYCLRSLLYKCYEMAIHPAPPSRYPIYRFNSRPYYASTTNEDFRSDRFDQLQERGTRAVMYYRKELRSSKWDIREVLPFR